MIAASSGHSSWLSASFCDANDGYDGKVESEALSSFLAGPSAKWGAVFAKSAPYFQCRNFFEKKEVPIRTSS
jgi:hypothetical protein